MCPYEAQIGIESVKVDVWDVVDAYKSVASSIAALDAREEGDMIQDYSTIKRSNENVLLVHEKLCSPGGKIIISQSSVRCH
jgi:hypothetical protein